MFLVFRLPVVFVWYWILAWMQILKYARTRASTVQSRCSWVTVTKNRPGRWNLFSNPLNAIFPNNVWNTSNKCVKYPENIQTMKLVVPGRKTINCKYALVFQTYLYWTFGVRCAKLLDVLTRIIFSKKFASPWYVGFCHHDMALLQVEVGGTPQICRLAANILNKQSRTSDKGWSSRSWLSEMLTNPHRQKQPCYELSLLPGAWLHT